MRSQNPTCVSLAFLMAAALLSSACGAVDLQLIEAMKKPDSATGPVEMRPKFLTDGSYDTADPSVPIQVALPDGQRIWTIIFSGGTVIYANSIDEFLRGGRHNLFKIEFRYPDGSEVTTDPYRIKAAPWDPDLALFKGAAGPEIVGYAGMMEKCNKDIEPTRAKDNWTRSRHAFHVEIWREQSSGQIRQVWSDLGSVHGYKPCEQRESPWLGPVHAHGYGSHYIEDRDGTPFLFFDEVTEQSSINGAAFPYRTEILVRRLDQSRTRAVGPKEYALKVSHTNLPHEFKAARRSFGGFLVEGPHLIDINVGGIGYYVLFFSAGDAFTDKYGSHYAYRLKSEGLNGPFTAAVDDEGELINVTQALSQEIDATWGIGRPNPFKDERGNLWIAAHLILKNDIPDDETKTGWPPTYEELVKRARRTVLVPLTAEMRDGRPLMNVLNKSP